MRLRAAFALLLASAGLSGAGAAELALKSGDFVAVVGDSITEQKQYSVFIEDYLLMARPADALRVAQFGWGGETANGFAGRMENDMLQFHPTVVTTCFGMNDGGYSPMTPDKAARYREKQTEIVKKCKQAGVRVIVLGSPGCVDADKFRGGGEAAIMYNKTLSEERDICRDIAQQEGVLFADVYSAMYDAMIKAKQKYGPNYHVGGGDGVHPDANGQLCMAFAFLKSLGCVGEIGRLEVDLAAGTAQATAGHKVLRASGGDIEIESQRYPFCFAGSGDAPNNPRSILPMLPFNAELNRYTLVVSGAKAPRYRVTWGAQNKEFTGAELANGINLASEFLDNPFLAPFQKVDHAVREQQNFETPLVKSLLHSMPEYRRYAPDSAAPLEKIAHELLSRDKQLFDASAAAVLPVTHAIKIEALQ